MTIKKSDKWPITLALLAGAITITIPLLIVAGMLYLASNYMAILRNVSDDSQAESSETR